MSRRPPPPTEKAQQALKKYRDARSNDKRRDIEKAIATYVKPTPKSPSLPSPVEQECNAKPSTSIPT